MGMYGRFKVEKKGRLFIVEPISTNAMRNADWLKGMANAPIGGAVHPDDSIINKDTCKEIWMTDKGESPLGFIDQIVL